MPASFAHVANKLIINSVFINPPPPPPFSSLPPSIPQSLINTLSEEIQISGKQTGELSVPIIFPPCEINRVYVYIFQQIFTRYFLRFHSTPFVNFVDNRWELFLENSSIPRYVPWKRADAAVLSTTRSKQVYLEARGYL